MRASMIGTGRAVEVLHDRGPAVPAARWTAGSGYLIGRRTVLTAAHTVDYRQDLGDDEQLLVRTVEGRELAARVVLVCEEPSLVDLALLEVSHPVFDEHLPSVAFARVDRDSPAPVTGCWAVGFPGFAEAGPVLPEGSERESWQVRGEILPGGKLRAGLLSLQVTSAPRPLPASLAGSEWEGMSGAVVFATDPHYGELALGVVSAHHRPEGESALTVVPVDAVARVQQAALWRERLGTPAPDRLPVVPRADRRRPVASKPVRLPPRPMFLAGREDLLGEIAAGLSGGAEPGPRVVTLCGLAGMGKTSIALEYAHRHLAAVDLVWLFPAEEPTALAAGFGELAAQLGARNLLDAGDPVAQVHGVLAAYPGDWLLVFDNAPEPSAVEAVLPPAGHGQVLITSRDPYWPVGRVVEVPVLDLAVATAFLLNRTGRPDEAEAARALADELGGLPLALEQAAAYMQATGRGIASYLTLFRQRRADLLARGEPAGYSKQVSTTWTLTFEQLRQTQPLAIGLLRLLACCAPDAIPLRLLLQPRPGLAETLTSDVADLLTPLLDDPLAADDAIAALRRYSLISAPQDGAVSVHRLVQAVTLSQVPAGLAEAWRQAAGFLVEAALPGDGQQPGTWPIYCVLTSEARQPPEAWPVFAVLLPHAQSALPADRDGMANVASYLQQRGNYAAARSVQQEVCDARTRVLGARHPGTLAALADLAEFTGWAEDAAAARDQYAELLPVMEQVLGAEHPHTLIARSGVAHWTGAAGDPARALAKLIELLPVMEQVLGTEHPATLFARANRAQFTGRSVNPAMARDQYTELLPIIERVFGAHRPGTLFTRANLASWTATAGDAAAARDQLAELLPVIEHVLGAEHPQTLLARAAYVHWAGEARDWMKDWDEEPTALLAARDQYAALQSAFERVFGSEHTETLFTRANLAYWTGEAGDAAAARDQYAALLPVFERVFGDEHAETLFTRANLALRTGEAGDPAAARDQYAALLSLRERVSGPEDAATLSVRAALARWTGEAGDPAAARDQYAALLPELLRAGGGEHFETHLATVSLHRWANAAGDAVAARDQYAALLPIYQQVSGPENFRTLNVQADLARWLSEAGNAAAARDQYAELLAIHKRVSGPENFQTLNVQADLARWTGEAGDPAAARDQYAALLPIRERVSGPEHLQTLNVRSGLARWTGEAGNATAARDQYAALVPVQERVSGPEDTETLIVRANLAFYTGSAGDPAAARDQYAALLPVQERVSGPGHPTTLAYRGNLARCWGELGDIAAARDQYAELLPIQERVSGPEHPATLIVRASLAHCSGMTGDAAGARDQYAELLPIYERVHGPEHPSTRTIRTYLARWTGEAGETDDNGTGRP
jgi:Trypsin-like peptidase domain/Tetratricopeptide repeat